MCGTGTILTVDDLIRMEGTSARTIVGIQLRPFQIQFGARAGLKETAQDLAMDGAKADLQLQERAGMRVALNQ